MSNGVCERCSCVKAGSRCSDCYPGRMGLCRNQKTTSENALLTSNSLTQNHCHSVPGKYSSTQSVSFDSEIDTTSEDLSSIADLPNMSVRDQDTFQDCYNAEHMSPLPVYDGLPEPSFVWGKLDGSSATDIIQSCYEEVVHWRRNIFKVPTGKAGNQFVRELSRLFRGYAEGSALESISLYAVMLMPALLLQKPHSKSKSKEHVTHLERRLALWTNGEFDELLAEGRTIQQNLRHQIPRTRRAKDNLGRIFSTLMMTGKVKAAIRLLSDEGHGVLSIDEIATPEGDSVRDVLLMKHPQGQPPHPSAIVSSSMSPDGLHSILFDSLNGDLIRRSALKSDGSSGPSGIDAAGWKRLLSSFRRYSSDLCEAVAFFCRRICTSYVDPIGLKPFLASRLIALDKQPGVRPIGVGEVIRRICGKAILRVLSYNIQEVAGPLQLCAGQDAGCEAAVHSMRLLFDSPSSEGILLVDANNAFNSLNRQNALRNILHLCPSFATVVINSYRSNSSLFIDGETLLSQEGTTQGDPMAMAIYAIGILPLIHHLADESVKQSWFADDASVGGNLVGIHQWWEKLVSVGPMYGYFPNPTKSWLIVKENCVDHASALFQNTGINITVDGKRHLGAALGSRQFVEEYVQNKVDGWVKEIDRLSSFAVSHPHAAYAAFTHGLSNKWTYLARTVPDIADLFRPLEEAIRHRFLPSLTNQNAFNYHLRELMALPVRFGGLNIIDPSSLASSQFQASMKITAPIVALIHLQSAEYPFSVIEDVYEQKSKITSERRKNLDNAAKELFTDLPKSLQRSVEVASEKGASTWLTALPLIEHGFALHKGSFRDALCLRYGWTPSYLPSHCVCGKDFTIEHALSCMCGGFPSIRHNEIRDATAHFLSDVCHDVMIEPPLQELTGEVFTHKSANCQDGARLDVAASGFWGCRERAFFDVRIFNPFARTNLNSSLSTCYRRHEMDKKRVYQQRITDIELSSFSPLVLSTAGGMGPIATVVFKRLASMVAEKQNLSYSRVLNWMRCRISFSLLRSSIMCLRGARSSQNHLSPAFGIETINLAYSEGKVLTG